MKVAGSLTADNLRRLNQAALASPHQGVLLIKDNITVYVNDKLSRLLGYPRDELMTWHMERYLRQVPAEYRTLMATLYQAVEQGGEEQERLEAALLNRAGEHLWVETLGHRVMLKEGPAVCFCLRDITAKKKAEKELRYSEESYRTLVEHVFGAIAVTNDEGDHLLVNPAYLDLTGYTWEELRHLNCDQLIIPEHRKEARVRIVRRLRGEMVPAHFETKLVRKDGTTISIEGVARKFQYRGQETNLACLKDVTARVEMEKELQRGNEELEKRVAERTAALAEANINLQA